MFNLFSNFAPSERKRSELELQFAELNIYIQIEREGREWQCWDRTRAASPGFSLFQLLKDIVSYA